MPLIRFVGTAMPPCLYVISRSMFARGDGVGEGHRVLEKELRRVRGSELDTFV